MHYDLFISYAHADDHDGFISQFVEKLLHEHLRFTGRQLSIFFDRQDLRGMDDWQARILAGLRDSRLFVAFVSPAYQESEYCRKEFAWWSQHEMHRFVLGEGVAPIYIVEVPGLYEAPLRTDQWSERMRGYQCHECRNFHPHGTAALEEQALEHTLHTLAVGVDDRLQRARLAEQSLTYSMPAYNHHFVGRRKELLQLRHALLEKSINAVTAIQGFGGIGKSELALTYAHAYAWDYPLGRFFVPCEHFTSLFTALGKVGEYLEVQFTDEEKTEEARALRVCNELRKRGQVLTAQDAPHHALLILDNVSDASMLTPRALSYLPPDVHVIVTTRLEPSRYSHLALQVLECLSLEDGLDLLEMYLPFYPIDPTEENAGRRIVDLLGGHAFSIEMVGAYLQARRDDGLRYTDYLHDLEQQGIRLLDETSSEAGIALFRHDEAQIGKLMTKTYDLLADDEREILAWAVCLPPDAVPLPWLRDFTGKRYPVLLDDAPSRSRTSRWQQALARLRGLRLITPIDEHLCRIHRLISATFPIADKEQHAYTAVITQRITECLDKEITYWYRGGTRWELEPIKHIVVVEWTKWQTGASIRRWSPRTFSIKCQLLGDIVLGIGDLASARRYYEQGLAIDKDLLARHSDSMEAQRGLSILYERLGDIARDQRDLPGAKWYYEQDLEICQELMWRQPESEMALRDLAVCYSKLGDIAYVLQEDLSCARKYYEQDLAICQELTARQTKSVQIQRSLAISYERLGNVARKQGDLSSARHYYENALAIFQELLDAASGECREQRTLAVSYTNLGAVAQAQGDLLGARQYYEQSMAICQELAVKLPESMQTKLDLAINNERLGDVAKREENVELAILHFDIAVNIRLGVISTNPEHPGLLHGILYPLSHLGTLTLNRGIPERSIECFSHGLAITRTLGDRDSEPYWQRGFGHAQKALGAFHEAEANFREAGELAREYGDRTEEGFAWSNLGDILLLQGYFAEAEAAFQAALLIANEVGKEANIAYRSWGLARIAHHLGQGDNAATHYSRALSSISADNDDEEEWLTHFGILQQEMGDTDGAHNLLTRALARCEELIAKSPERYAPYYTRALAYLAIGDTDTAMAAYREALTHCSANGVIHEALLTLRLLRRAQPDAAAIAPVEELLRQAMESP